MISEQVGRILTLDVGPGTCTIAVSWRMSGRVTAHNIEAWVMVRSSHFLVTLSTGWCLK